MLFKFSVQIYVKFMYIRNKNKKNNISVKNIHENTWIVFTYVLCLHHKDNT